MNTTARTIERAETGVRDPGPGTGRLIAAIAVAWSLFQLWIVSPFPYQLGIGVVPETQARALHLAFAVLLAFLLFPGRRPLARGRPLAVAFHGLLAAGLLVLALLEWRSGGAWPGMLAAMALLALALALAATRRQSVADRVPLIDVGLGLLAAFCAAYLFLFHQELAERAGRPSGVDMLAAGLGLILLLEASRRVLGPALMVIAGLFLLYVFAGPWMPDLIAHGGASLGRAMSQQWLSNEGVFGIALGVSSGFVFLFVLFGALLERAGAGGYFIRVAFALLGRYRGGPAKAAVAASGLTGMISGSSIANVVTTGTFTIPLMKRNGFSASKAGAVEVAGSVNGQLMPPVMGAAAFLMVEYVGISYVEVIRHAFLPAVIAYIALLYIVHLEARKAGLRGLPGPERGPLFARLMRTGLLMSGLLVLAGVVYYGLGWIKTVAGAASFGIIAVLALLAYIGLLRHASRFTEPPDDEVLADGRLPAVAPTVQGGLYHLLPVVILIWGLVVERLSPGLAAFWAVLFLIAILLTQRPLRAWFAGREAPPAGGAVDRAALWRRGGQDLLAGLINGARNMIGIAVATAAAGIIVGTVAMTGISLVMVELVEWLSGGHLLAMLMLTALICLLLGLGLPTTANYIVVATLMAPVIVALGAENGLLVPLIAAHLFVFYFGLMADVTPPVGLASFAAAAIARADPIRTGLHALWYGMRTVALPFLFLFNPQLLLIGIDGPLDGLLTMAGAVVGMLVFVAATQNHWLARNRVLETLGLLLVALTLFVPSLWMDRLHPPLERLPAGAVMEQAEATPDGGFLRLEVAGMDLEGRERERRVMLPLEDGDPVASGLHLMTLGDRVSVSAVDFGSAAERVGLESGWRVTAVLAPTERPAPEWFYLPALALLVLIGWRQRRRVLLASTAEPQGN
ncbi:MAG: TRAP transporter permease [Pseudomonadota bacterium]